MKDLARPDLVGPALARAVGDDRWAEASATLIAGGKSNLTFELTSAAGSVILRRPPDGRLLPRAHDMGREARVQAALADTGVPVPGVLLLEETGDLLGVPFYVMEKVAGHIIRDELPAGYADGAGERVMIADALVDTLAALHAVDVEEVGLADFGRPAGFMSRQVRRWGGQWEQSKTHDVAEVDELARRVDAVDFPEPARPVVVHGDFRLDNCLMDLDSPARVAGVLDWELSTIGDPLADLGMLLFYWREAGEPPPALTPDLMAAPGFPGRAHLVERYADRTGADLALLPAYVAFAHLKFAVIAQGIAARVTAGAMAGQDFGDLTDEVVRIAVEGLDRLDDRS